MRKIFVALCTVCVFGLAFLSAPARSQQDKSKRPSPPAKADFSFPDGKTIKINYSSPRVRGRDIFPGLQAYGVVWRAGANEATVFTTDTNLVVGGKDVPAGEYSLDVIPDAKQWTLIVSKKVRDADGSVMRGIPYPGDQFDLMRTTMKLEVLSTPMENLTYSFDKTDRGCVMHLEWEKANASVEISEKK